MQIRFSIRRPPIRRLYASDTKYVLVVTANGRMARATTITPGPFRVREGVVLDEKTEEVQRRLKTFADVEDGVFLEPENRVVYKTGFLEARFNPNDVPGYQVGIVSLDTDADPLDRGPFDDDLEKTGSSPAIESTEGTVSGCRGSRSISRGDT